MFCQLKCSTDISLFQWDDTALLMVVYDVTSEQSFKSCNAWIKNIRNANPDKSIPGMLFQAL